MGKVALCFERSKTKSFHRFQFCLKTGNGPLLKNIRGRNFNKSSGGLTECKNPRRGEGGAISKGCDYFVFQFSASIIRWWLKSLAAGSFQGNNKKPAIGRKVSRGTYEREALMQSHGYRYFPRGNEKKTGATLKDFK